MFGRVLILLVITLSGCAQQRYETAPVTGSPSDQDGTICAAKFRVSGNCLVWSWVEKPTETKTGSLTFKVLRPNQLDGSLVPADLTALPSVVLWMPSMGHGSTPTRVEKVDTGSYRVTEVFFVMPGEWEIKFRADDGVADEAVVSLTI